MCVLSRRVFLGGMETRCKRCSRWSSLGDSDKQGWCGGWRDEGGVLVTFATHSHAQVLTLAHVFVVVRESASVGT